MKDTEAEFIILTPEYLFDKGIKYYKKALDVQSKNDNATIESQQVYAKAMLYLQGAMFLGSSDASNFLIKIYNESEINNKQVSNLIKIIYGIENFSYYYKRTQSTNLNDFGITDLAELDSMASLPLGYMGGIRINWNNVEISKSLILDTLEEFASNFNSSLSPEYHLITRKNIVGYKENIQDKINERIVESFVLCEPPQATWYRKLFPKKKPIENTKYITANEVKKPNEVPKLPQKVNSDQNTNQQTWDYESSSMKPKSDSSEFLELMGGCPIS
ncbi:hypothetical protein A3306_06370 [Rickettsia bellii]|uniref:Uncharacterized protein n=1 Tax=Rickettsia bellii str. RML An4 TaxID=1359193 RepID=A0A0F3QAJ6_RICBE|nr:hypothetical protein [Rickettsia bellii]ARD86752.1 hypothetical protein A3306_06370 [Rickettsia bellii]KJV89558.1 hypothetical protein RBEAN4_0537 [Rickettsia bellii str. RML An4]